MRNLVVVIICLLSVAIANGNVIHTLPLGIEIMNPMMTAPGNHFELDYTSILGEDQPPYTIHGLTLMIDVRYSVESFNITLGNDPTVYSFEPDSIDDSALAIHLYNSIFETPTGNMPFMEMPTGWISELEDGIWSGQIWFDGTRMPEQTALLTTATYLVPEPASITMLACAGSLYMLRRKKKNQ